VLRRSRLQWWRVQAQADLLSHGQSLRADDRLLRSGLPERLLRRDRVHAPGRVLLFVGGVLRRELRERPLRWDVVQVRRQGLRRWQRVLLPGLQRERLLWRFHVQAPGRYVSREHGLLRRGLQWQFLWELVSAGRLRLPESIAMLFGAVHAGGMRPQCVQAEWELVPGKPRMLLGDLQWREL